GCYTDARDLKKFKSDGNPSATYKNRVPNKPWLFGNIFATYKIESINLLPCDALSIRADIDWTHWFYLNWEAFGAAASKAKIPTQTITSIAATYSWMEGRYNLSLECDNIFDRLAYDNYMLQKPGRSFSAKFRVFIE
ncbi:MAG: TonB-dependent receptor, partial [Duncaniella sp.]|nr:TonB-dependent receptor [Duncaniella sp.]